MVLVVPPLANCANCLTFPQMKQEIRNVKNTTTHACIFSKRKFNMKARAIDDYQRGLDTSIYSFIKFVYFQVCIDFYHCFRRLFDLFCLV